MDDQDGYEAIISAELDELEGEVRFWKYLAAAFAVLFLLSFAINANAHGGQAHMKRDLPMADVPTHPGHGKFKNLPITDVPTHPGHGWLKSLPIIYQAPPTDYVTKRGRRFECEPVPGPENPLCHWLYHMYRGEAVN